MSIITELVERLRKNSASLEINFSTAENLRNAADVIEELSAKLQEPILDKIRAEIKALSNANPSYTHTCDVVDRDDVLDIIDKYIEGSDSE